MRYLLVVICLMVSTTAAADTLSTQQAAEGLVASVMKRIAGGKPTEGLDLLKPYVTIAEQDFNNIRRQLKEQAPKAERQYGKSVGMEHIATTMAGKSLMMVTYIQKFEKNILHWSFYFYKPVDGWVVHSFTTNDNIRTLFASQIARK